MLDFSERAAEQLSVFVPETDGPTPRDPGRKAPSHAILDRMARRSHLFVFAVLGALMMAGCGSGSPPPSPSTASTSTTTTTNAPLTTTSTTTPARSYNGTTSVTDGSGYTISITAHIHVPPASTSI